MSHHHWHRGPCMLALLGADIAITTAAHTPVREQGAKAWGGGRDRAPVLLSTQRGVIASQ
jgi:hypothetical protein